MCFVTVGAEAVAILSNRLSQINVQTRFMVDDNAWPPEQPVSYTPLLLINYQGHRTPEQVTAMAKLMCSGNIDKVASVTDDSTTKHSVLDSHNKVLDTNSRATKNIEEFLAPLDKQSSAFILIEGPPGIGKSVLLKEIAYRWGKRQLLTKFKLVLLVCLRDPSLQLIKSVDDLLQLFCRGDKHAAELVSACSQYLFASGGESLTLLFDGYDEYSHTLQKGSLIADILKRQVLPLCGLVVSSRPHASEHLRKQATIIVDILGFTEMEREYCIKQALTGQPHKIKELTQYLHQQPSIDSICFIPFNMVVLLYLFKLGISLPKNSTELYRYFICSTIVRHLSKFGMHLTHNITDLTYLPEPYNTIIRQLSKLSLEGLDNHQLIFTLDEITAACPDIATIPGAINGFGLLQAVQHFGVYTKTMTFNFIHCTIQEFLAAHYIANLPPNEELKVIEAKFWNSSHFNTFAMYISLTKGQQPSFKTFLSDKNKAITISPKFLTDQLKCLHLYHYFNEADDRTMCNTIEQAEIFNHKEITLLLTSLTASDMECLSTFLASSSNKEWVKLNLWNCYIQDKGLTILYRGLRHSKGVTIDKVELTNNGLTTQSSSLISEFTVKCEVKELVIGCNSTIGEDRQLYTMLIDPSNTLEELHMVDNKLSSGAASNLFKALKNNNTLKVVNIRDNIITDNACDAITAALEQNSCLVKLSMYNNPLSSKVIIDIVRCLEVNDTLQLLGIPRYPQDVQENIICLQEVINKKRETRGCYKKLEVNFRTQY